MDRHKSQPAEGARDLLYKSKPIGDEGHISAFNPLITNDAYMHQIIACA